MKFEFNEQIENNPQAVSFNIDDFDCEENSKNNNAINLIDDWHNKVNSYVESHFLGIFESKGFAKECRENEILKNAKAGDFVFKHKKIKNQIYSQPYEFNGTSWIYIKNEIKYVKVNKRTNNK